MNSLDYNSRTVNQLLATGGAVAEVESIPGQCETKRVDLRVVPPTREKDYTLERLLVVSDKVAILDPREIEKAASVITEAFMDYPLPGQYIRDANRRRIALQEMFKVELRKAFRKGSVYTLGGDFQEVAIWKHEVVAESDFAYIKYIRLSTLKLMFSMRISECVMLFKALRNVLDTKLSLNLPANASELYIVGVNPANQGQGRLSRLLKPVLKELQEQGRSVLVMTNTDSNRKIYEHLGFKLVKVLDDTENDCISYYLVK